MKSKCHHKIKKYTKESVKGFELVKYKRLKVKVSSCKVNVVILKYCNTSLCVFVFAFVYIGSCKEKLPIYVYFEIDLL